MSVLPEILRAVKSIRGNARTSETSTGGRVLFAFMGMADNWRGAGAALYRTEKAFRASVDACSSVVEANIGCAAYDLFRDDHAERPRAFMHVVVSQLALVDLWRSVGVTPDGVTGVSLGEAGATYAAGIFSREDALTVACAAARYTTDNQRESMVYIVQSPAAAIHRLTRAAPAPLHFAGEPKPEVAMLVSDTADAAVLGDYLASRVDVLAQMPTRWRYHTPDLTIDHTNMDRAFNTITARPAKCPVYSAVIGGRLPDEARFDKDLSLWILGNPFRFGDAIAAACADGFDTVLTIGPSVMTSWIRSTARHVQHQIRVVETLDPSQPEIATWKRARRKLRSLRRRSGAQRKPSVAATLDLKSPGVVGDPFRHYEALRKEGTVVYLPRHDSWLVLGYDDVRTALMQPNLYSNVVYEPFDRGLLSADPPRHTAMRNVVSEILSTDTIDRLVTLAEERAPELLEPELNIVSAYAQPLMHAVAAELVGFPDDIADAIVDALQAFDLSADRTSALIRVLDSNADRAALYESLLRRNATLEDREARSLVRLLWMAATTTTIRAISWSVFYLLKHSEARQTLTADPSLLPAFIDEVLRLHPPEHLLRRRATQEASLGGIKIPAGASVYLCVAAANRDPKVFPDSAVFQARRDPNRHLSFGGGIHHCIGAALGRRLIEVALRTLLREAPDFRALQPLLTIPCFRTMSNVSPARLVIRT